MSANHQIILLQKKEKELFLNHRPKKACSLAFIPSSLCTQSLFDTDIENLLLKAYQDKLLSKEQNYLSFCFPSKLQNKTLCFFAPITLLSSAKFAMLDLSLPTQIPHKELCVLFVYPSNSLLCFYQNQVLQYSKIIYHHTQDIQLCKHYLKTLFDYTSTLYCLSYIHPLPEVLQSLNLAPLSSLFLPSPPDFGLHFEKITLIQNEGILSLSSPPSQSSRLLKFMFFSFLFFSLSTFAFCFFTHSPPPTQENDTHSIQILSTLQSLSSNKPLFLLLQTLNQTLKNTPLLHVQFRNTTLTLAFKDQIPNHLIALLSSKGYVLKTTDSTTLEIAL